MRRGVLVYRGPDPVGKMEIAVEAIGARREAKHGTAAVDYLKLDEMGILGVTHMMMLDKKILEIADIMLDWVNENVAR